MNLDFLVLVVVLHTRPILCQLLTVPTNAIAQFGQRVQFECSRPTNLQTPLNWKFAAVNSTRFEYIFVSERITRNFSSRCVVDTSREGHWTLVVNSADMSNAGTYRCLTIPNYDIEEADMSASAQLIVLDSDPMCDTNASNYDVVEGDYIQMQCFFSYRGNWIPVMECTRNDGKTVNAKAQYGYESGKANLSLVTEMTSNENGVTFICKLSFSSNILSGALVKVGDTQAANIPHYEYSWNYTAHVIYGPVNLTIMQVGRRLECIARGNPAPSYEWELLGKNISLGNGSVLVVNELMISDKEQTLRCTATNNVAGQIRSNEATFVFNLTAGTSSQSNNQYLTTVLIVGSIAGALLLCLVVAIIIIWKARTRVFRVEKTPVAPVQPIYAVVNKERNGDAVNILPENHRQRQQEIPVYTEVKKHENDKKKTGTAFRIAFPTESTPKQVDAGTDGTVYEEMNVLTDEKVSVAPAKHPQLFSLVETYASVDHTMGCQPPPLPKRN